jgi:hypothetical protein
MAAKLDRLSRDVHFVSGLIELDPLDKALIKWRRDHEQRSS